MRASGVWNIRHWTKVLHGAGFWPILYRKVALEVLGPQISSTFHGMVSLEVVPSEAIVPVQVATAADLVRSPIFELHYSAKTKEEAIAVYSEIIYRFNYWRKVAQSKKLLPWHKTEIAIV